MSAPAILRPKSHAAPVAVAAVAVVLALLACAPALTSPFFDIDDTIYVTQNTVLQQVPLAKWWRVFTYRTNPWEYLPLRDLSYRLDLAVFGAQPTGFRVHNLILYGLTCAAVWWLVLSLLARLRGRDTQPEDRWIAALTTALFAVHPAHVESVVWIAGRKDLLSGLFAVLSLALFTRGVGADPPAWRQLVGAYALFGCAILSKSTVVTVPVVAWLIAMAGHDGRARPWPAARRASVWAAPLFLLALVSVWLQVGASATYATDALEGTAVRAPFSRLLLAVRILGTLARIAVFPYPLRLIYDVEEPGTQLAVVTVLGVAAGTLTVLGVWLAPRRRSLAWLGAAMAGILVAPFLQIIPFYTWSYASERFLFIAVIGVAAAVASGLCRLQAGPRWALLTVLLLLGTSVSALRSVQWRDARAMYTDTARLAPTNDAAVEIAIRHVLLPEGKFAEARAAAARVRVDAYRSYLLTYVEAREALHRGDLARLRVFAPKMLEVVNAGDDAGRIEAANLVLEAGLLPVAERAYRDLLRDFPAAVPMRYNLGLVLKRQGRYAEAAEAIQRAISGGFETADVWNNLGLVTRDAGQPQAAAEAFRKALAYDSRHWHAGHNLARLLWALGDRDGARQALSEARRRALAAGASTRPLDELEGAFNQSERHAPQE